VARRGETREKILRATVRTLATEGFGGTTARSIARTGGFAPGVIY
jgi:AcrR family transcriptional regulator